jgi:hypothetical protein
MIDPIGGEMGAVGAAAGVDGPITLTLEMDKSLMLRLNRLDQQVSQFQTQVQASFAQQRDRSDHKFTTINNNIRCFEGTIEGSLLIQQENNGRRLRRVGEELPAEGIQDFISTLSPPIQGHFENSGWSTSLESIQGWSTSLESMGEDQQIK